MAKRVNRARTPLEEDPKFQQRLANLLAEADRQRTDADIERSATLLWREIHAKRVSQRHKQEEVEDALPDHLASILFALDVARDAAGGVRQAGLHGRSTRAMRLLDAALAEARSHFTVITYAELDHLTAVAAAHGVADPGAHGST